MSTESGESSAQQQTEGRVSPHSAGQHRGIWLLGTTYARRGHMRAAATHCQGTQNRQIDCTFPTNEY